MPPPSVRAASNVRHQAISVKCHAAIPEGHFGASVRRARQRLALPATYQLEATEIPISDYMNFCTDLSGFRSLLASATVPIIPQKEGRMYHQVRSHDFDGILVHSDAASTAIARVSGSDALAALEQI